MSDEDPKDVKVYSGTARVTTVGLGPEVELTVRSRGTALAATRARSLGDRLEPGR